MDTWKQAALGALFVIILNFVFQIHKMPPGASKYFVYFGLSAIPGFYYTNKKAKTIKEFSQTDFVVGLLCNTFLIVLVSTIVLVILNGIF